MTKHARRAAFLLAALTVPAAAQPSLEATAVAGAARFEAATLPPSFAVYRPTLSAGMPRLDAAGAESWERDLSATASVVTVAAFAPAAPDLTADLELAPLLNRHLMTRLHYRLSGRSVWFSGGFDRQQKPFVSVLVEGAAPRFFDVKGLLNEDQKVSVGGASYTLSLSANIFHRMKSTINLKNDANSRESARFSVSEMLDAVAAAGEPVSFRDQAYRFYFADGLTGGRPDPANRFFVFITGNSSDFHVYMIPVASVPADRLGVFKLFNEKRVGLIARDGRLEIYENP